MKEKLRKIDIHRNRLRDISELANEFYERELARAEIEGNTDEMFYLENLSMNEKIWIFVYKREEMHSFNRWKEKGFHVKKGAKAKLLWGQPIKAEKKKEEKNKKNKDDEMKKYEFFPVAFVFAKKDVVKHKTEQTQ